MKNGFFRGHGLGNDYIVMDPKELTFKLTDGTLIKVAANSVTGQATITAADDIAMGGQPTIVNKLESVTGADTYEKLTLGENALETKVTDEPGSGTPTDNQGDKVGITITGNGPVQVEGAGADKTDFRGRGKMQGAAPQAETGNRHPVLRQAHHRADCPASCRPLRRLRP